MLKLDIHSIVVLRQKVSQTHYSVAFLPYLCMTAPISHTPRPRQDFSLCFSFPSMTALVMFSPFS